MISTNPGKAYRQHAVQTESLPDIFIHAYDRLVGLLHSAAASVDARDIEAKTHTVNHALDLIICLQRALDFERGGDVASSLDRFYTLLRGEIFAGSAKLNSDTLRSAARHVSEVRQLWEREKSIAPDQAARELTRIPDPSMPDSGSSDMHNSPSGGWSA